MNNNDIRLAVIGLTPGNGHPYSWSAMFNGYDRQAMTKECPYAGIPEYLNKQPEDTLRIPGARVTRICCAGEEELTVEHAAKPDMVMGEVDAQRPATA